jgi:hypothetical protein
MDACMVVCMCACVIYQVFTILRNLDLIVILLIGTL